jgi:pyruvate dehydrogenase E2 component (dihydrolipoamide acetyltransferase)
MNVIMPQLGETVLEGSVANWHKKVGDQVQADEPLFDVETDKVTSEIPAPIAGVLTQILVQTGVSVKVGTVLAVIESQSAAGTKQVQAAAVVTALAPVQPALPSARAGQASGQVLARASAGQPPLSPVVRRLLGENGLSPAQVSGTGNNGRITREDVLAHLATISRPSAPDIAPQPAVASPAPSQASLNPSPLPSIAAGKDDMVVPLNKIRRVTASHMVRSLATSPHAVQAMEIDFHAVDKVRMAVGREWKEREGYSLTYMPFIARAVCESIAKYPYVNSSFGDNELIVHRRVHLGIAVDVNFEGLLAPVVRDAHFRNLRGLAAEIHRLATGARNNQLKPDELSGGTYTISNSGTFGTLFSTSIINQPQAAILSADGVHKKPVVIEGAEGEMIAIRPIGIVAQSFDHRAFDGAYSASFLRHLKDFIESHDWMREL